MTKDNVESNVGNTSNENTGTSEAQDFQGSSIQGSSKGMKTIIRSIFSESGQKTPDQQEAKELGQQEVGGSEQEEGKEVNNNSEEEKSGKDKKPDDLLVKFLKFLLKIFGPEEEKENNNTSQDLDPLKELCKNFLNDLINSERSDINGLKEIIQGLKESNSQSDQQNASPYSSSQQKENTLGSTAPTEMESKPTQNDLQNTSSSLSSEKEEDSQFSTPSPETKSNQNKEENNPEDELVTKMIVGFFEQEGKLDDLKAILNKVSSQNSDDEEIKKLIDGFNAQISEVEKARETTNDEVSETIGRDNDKQQSVNSGQPFTEEGATLSEGEIAVAIPIENEKGCSLEVKNLLGVEEVISSLKENGVAVDVSVSKESVNNTIPHSVTLVEGQKTGRQ